MKNLDILIVIDGRAEFQQELLDAENHVKDYLVNEFKNLLLSPDIQYLIQSTAGNDKGRAQLIFERIKTITTT